MCGRFTLRTSAGAIAQHFGLLKVAPFSARFNIAPTQAVAVVRAVPVEGDEQFPPHATRPTGQSPATGGGGRELVWLRWGLVPGWTKDAGIGSRLINARAETAASKPAFRTAMRQRRCLVAADGFYEWQRAGRAKQPYFIRLRDDRPMAFAGLWEAWQLPDHAAGQIGKPPHVSRLETCALLTTAANDLVRPIHDRMPVILPPEAYPSWLDPEVEDPRRLVPLLVPYPSAEMEAYRVSSLVNDPAQDSPRCIEPAEGALF